MRATSALLGLGLLSGCLDVSWDGSEQVGGSGTVATRTVDVDSASAIELDAPGTLVVERGTGPLVIEGDDNLVDRLVIEVEDGTLVIGTPEKESFRPKTPLQYRVGVDRLERVDILEDGRIEAAGIETDDFALRIVGRGSADLTGLRAKSASVETSGHGDVRVTGRADHLDVGVSGAGVVEAGDLEAIAATAGIAGSGRITLRAERSLEARAVGASEIRYYGSPEVTREAIGDGVISRAGD